ncbi:MAG: DegV family protein [Lachnospiraceae bacterium]|nr:DegV family protein [Lachnospiraceae bacterium]
MDKKFHIISDGACDLPPQLTKEKNVTVVPFYVSFDDEHYQKEIEEIGIRDFYQKMVAESKIYPKSSMPSVQDYADAFLPIIKQKLPIICICITTKFSGSMQSAVNAKNMLLETYPDAQITVIDATVNTVLQGLYVLEAVRMQESGAGYKETASRLEEIKSTGRIFFTVGNMEYLQHGGRIGKVAGIAGSVLGIRPIITLKQGEIFPSGIARSRKKSMEKTIDLVLNYLKEQGDSIEDFSIAVGFGYDYEEAISYRDMALKTLGEKYGLQELPIYQIGATIGVHTGPYPLGLGIIKKSVL